MNRARRRPIGLKLLEQGASTNEILGKKRYAELDLSLSLNEPSKVPSPFCNPILVLSFNRQSKLGFENQNPIDS
jgi:hypothetical protein